MSSEVATLAGGCFWCIEAVFREVAGVENAIPGYTGGAASSPTYEQVCQGNTGHAESVQVTFDNSLISYRDILDIFFSIHDPTTLNQQGSDIGTQYRSAIFYHCEAQRTAAQEAIKELNEQHLWNKPIVTQVAPASKFYPAEEYHKDYFAKHPAQGYCQVVVSPKVSKFRRQWAGRLKAGPTGR